MKLAAKAKSIRSAANGSEVSAGFMGATWGKRAGKLDVLRQKNHVFQQIFTNKIIALTLPFEIADLWVFRHRVQLLPGVQSKTSKHTAWC